MNIGKNAKFFIGNVEYTAYLKGWQLNESHSEVSTCTCDFILMDKILTNKIESKPKNLYSLVYLGIGIIVFCLLWSL